ncbi:MAG: 8-oxo-dGTP diphosphatase MutT [Pseudomonadota bacterium]
MTKVVLVVAAALFNEQNEVLLAQRPKGKSMAGLWEFPGGKMDSGESPEAALVRELSEELGIKVSESSLEPLTFASHRYPDFHLLMPLFVCREWVGVPIANEGQSLSWASLDTVSQYDAPAADIPLFEYLKKYGR